MKGKEGGGGNVVEGKETNIGVEQVKER